MRIHALLTILILTVALCATVPRLASAGHAQTMDKSDAEHAVEAVFNTGRALKQIDLAFASGALTWSEAKALYAEQALIRNAYIQGKVTHGPLVAARRAAFMMRMSQSTYARLAFNTEQRQTIERQVTWLW